YGGNSVTSAYSLSPYASLTDSLGNYILFPQTTTSYVNPFLTIPTSGYNNSGNLQGIFSATVKVPWVRGLSYTVNYSKNYRTSESGSFYGFQTYQGQSSKGTGSSSVGTALSSLVDHIIRYNNTFANVHNVDLTLVNSNTKNTGKSYGLTASGFDNDALGTNYLQAGATQSLSTSAYEDEAIGQMARLTYTYDNKYAITGTIRHDGFSAFSANHKWGNFPSVGVNWNITKENFMKKVSFVNHLDLRASYGTVGNQSIDRYSTLSKIGNSYYVYQGISTPVFTQAVVTPANNDLLWESTTGLNFGLDFSLLRNRLSGSVDGYFTKTNNMAFSRPLPATTGFGSILVNAGEIQNRGIELNLHSLNIETGKFSWSSDAAFSLNRNKITHLLGDVDGDGKEDDMVSSN
ncbi:MAG TPA: TonB-dependent receptor, partial [Flavisolibacter sp.]|nr:TonB-dependent receptor [Flavisolibacter sp.]